MSVTRSSSRPGPSSQPARCLMRRHDAEISVVGQHWRVAVTEMDVAGAQRVADNEKAWRRMRKESSVRAAGERTDAVRERKRVIGHSLESVSAGGRRRYDQPIHPQSVQGLGFATVKCAAAATRLARAADI